MYYVKAISKRILMAVVGVAAIWGIIAMWFSSKFIPVYVNGEYILANQLVRYGLYILIALIGGYAFIKATTPIKKRRPRRR